MSPGSDSVRVVAADAAGIEEAVRALRDGRVVAYPTDTLYGLAGDPLNTTAVEMLFALKGRAPGQAVPLIAADVDQVQSVAELSPLALRLAAGFWPGPLTIVIRTRIGWPAGIAAADGTIAVRVPNHRVARALAQGLGRPITATSANRSGDRAATSAADAASRFGDALALVLDDGPSAGGVPSTIVDATGESPRLVREGVVPWDRVLESLE